MGTNDALHIEQLHFVPQQKMGMSLIHAIPGSFQCSTCGWQSTAGPHESLEILTHAASHCQCAPRTDERHGDPRFYRLLDEIAELHSRKNHDYSRTDDPLSNFRKAEAFGVEAWRGVLVRMSDKFSRLEQLSTGKVAKNESLRDSLIDLAVYSLICVLLRDEVA